MVRSHNFQELFWILGVFLSGLFGLKQLYFHGYIHSWTSELPYILSLQRPGFNEKLFQIQASPDLSCAEKEKAKITIISISFVRPVHFNILITCMLVLVLVAQHHAIKDTVDCLIVVTVNDPDSVTGNVCDFYHMEVLLTRFSHKLKLKKFFFEHCSYGLITFFVRQNPYDTPNVGAKMSRIKALVVLIFKVYSANFVELCKD